MLLFNINVDFTVNIENSGLLLVLAKNTRLSTLSGFKRVLLSITMLPPTLNSLLELILVAIFAGNLLDLDLHDFFPMV